MDFKLTIFSYAVVGAQPYEVFKNALGQIFTQR
jgi:predicted DsbA family dithiol-disulfide isomerase